MATKKAVLDRSMIEDFSQKVDTSSAEEVFYKLSDIIDDITIELAPKNALLNLKNIDLIQAGDYAINSNVLHADLNFYLTVKSAQIELNTTKELESKKNILISKIKNAWEKRKRLKKISFRKKKKREQIITQKSLIEKKEKPFTIISLKDEYFENLASRFSDVTVLYDYSNKITILANEEFGFKINIYPALVHDDELRIWDPTKNKFDNVYLLDAIKLIEKKNSDINKNYAQNYDSNLIRFGSKNEDDLLLKIIRIFKSLIQNIWQSTNNFSFVESLIYNCPNSLFSGKADETFIRILNFLQNTDIINFKSIYNQNESMFSQDKISLYEINVMLKEISKMLSKK